MCNERALIPLPMCNERALITLPMCNERALITLPMCNKRALITLRRANSTQPQFRILPENLQKSPEKTRKERVLSTLTQRRIQILKRSRLHNQTLKKALHTLKRALCTRTQFDSWQKAMESYGKSPRNSQKNPNALERALWRGGGLGSRPKKMYGERLGDGVEYHLMSPTPRR